MWLLRFGRRLGRGGNVLILSALAALPTIGIVALAVDFGRANILKTSLDLAADSAALAGVTTASNAWMKGDPNAVAEGIAAAQARFQAQSGPQFAALTAPINVAMTRNGGLFNVSVGYTGQIGTSFARALGVLTLPVNGQSGASLSLNPYVDIQILMDVSSSMTVAATTQDIAAMTALTKGFIPNGSTPSNIDPGEGCAFACHWTTTNVDYYQLAVKNKIQLRITVLQDAVAQLINTLVGLDTSGRFELGLYTFSQQFNVVEPLSYNIANELPSVSAIVPDINSCTNNCPDTYFDKAMQSLTTLDQGLPQQGPQVPQRFLFLVSDGVYDQYSSSGARQIGAFNPKDCDALKALGFSILVLYTPYLPLPTNGFYVANVQPISPQIVPNLEACASSPNYFFVAADAAGIKTQLQNMLQLVVQSSGHLTN